MTTEKTKVRMYTFKLFYDYNHYNKQKHNTNQWTLDKEIINLRNAKKETRSWIYWRSLTVCSKARKKKYFCYWSISVPKEKWIPTCSSFKLIFTFALNRSTVIKVTNTTNSSSVPINYKDIWTQQSTPTFSRVPTFTFCSYV